MRDRTEWTFAISGMTCDHCARSIDAALGKVRGVVASSTRFPQADARVVAEAPLDAAIIASAIRGMGYGVQASSSRPIGDREEAAGPALDLVAIGGGSAGFAAAIRAAEHGASAAIVEAGEIGGTCVNVGCVPSKTLIRAAEALHRARHHGFAGIRAALEPPDLAALVRQKDELVATLRKAKYEDVLAAYPSIRLVRGRARFRPDGTLEVDGRPLAARNVVLTMGSHPWAPPISGLVEARPIGSTEALALREIPRSLVTIGGSAVGLEIAQVFARLGSSVTVLEALPRLVAMEDEEIGEALARELSAEGIAIHTGATVQRIEGGPGAVRVEALVAGRSLRIESEQLLVATGRRPSTAGMGLEEAGIRLGGKGEVLVDERLATTRPGVWAAGDVTGGPMFVYVAAHGGTVVADNAVGAGGRTVELDVVPRVTFTDPAVASVGLTEAEARARGMQVAVSRLPLSHVPRAIAARDTRGLVKLVADRATNLLAGAHILAPEAGEMIQEAAMAIRFRIRVDQIAGMLHPYLTLSEGIKLACQTFDKDVAKLSCCAA